MTPTPNNSLVFSGKFLQFTIYLHYLFDLPKKNYGNPPVFSTSETQKKHMFHSQIFIPKIVQSQRPRWGTSPRPRPPKIRQFGKKRIHYSTSEAQPSFSSQWKRQPLGMGMNGLTIFCGNPIETSFFIKCVEVEIIRHFEGTQNFAFGIMYHVPKILWQLHFSYFQWSTHEGSLPHWALDNILVKCPHSEQWGDTSSVGVPSEQFAKSFFTRNWCKTYKNDMLIETLCRKTFVNQQGHLASTTNLPDLHRTNPSEEPNHPCKVLVYSNKGESAPITQGWCLAVWTIWLSCCRKKKGAA